MGPEVWHALTTSRYTRALEKEVERLRAENRALVNSLLGTAGVPPLSVEVAGPARPGGQACRGREAGGEAGRQGQPVTPLRRRSWHQIGRMLEREEARQKHALRELTGL